MHIRCVALSVLNSRRAEKTDGRRKNRGRPCRSKAGKKTITLLRRRRRRRRRRRWVCVCVVRVCVLYMCVCVCVCVCVWLITLHVVQGIDELLQSGQ